ncbi:MAG: CotH kinase family protein [Ruminococcus sp.]|nr:CotH kinase family protein [Ruminococcus sp.]
MKRRAFGRCVSAGVAALICAAALPQSVMTVGAASGVRINEVCTKNTTVPAPDGQFYDFVELYNPTGSPISISGYGLSDDAAVPMRYTLPADASVPAHGYYIIYCGVGTASGVQGASFGLSKSGETVVLSDAGGNAVETVNVPALNDNTSYGRAPDGGDQFAVLTSLTPGSSNPADENVQTDIEEPDFSKESGFYSDNFDLTISAPKGCTVYYTLDGSDPTTASQRADGNIRIYDRSSERNVYSAKTDIADGYSAPSSPVDKATIVRAVAVDQNGNVSDIVTKTYFVGYTSSDCEMNMRVISLVTDPYNLFDYEKGIYVKGKIYDQSAGDPSKPWAHPANYTQDGKEWERPAHITVFEKGTAAYSANVGIRIHGAATRSDAQKSFNLYARSDYGTKKLKYDFFDGKLTNHKGEVIDSFDKLTLRNGGNDNKTKIRDRLNQEMVGDRHYGTQAQTECVVFLDGEFWGTYNIVEKLGKEYIADHYKVKEGSVCMIKNGELSDGTDQGMAEFEQLKSLANTDLSDSAGYAKISELVDLKSFAEYMATELIVGNSDFGDNNYSLWKTETIDPDKKYADGKWRFLLFDTEYGQGLYGQSNASTNAITTLKNKNKWITQLFFGLCENGDFRDLFLAAYFDQCNENFSSEKVLARLNELEQAYKASMGKTYVRYGWNGNSWGFGGRPGAQPADQQKTGEEKFSGEVKTIRNFWTNRISNCEKQMLDYFRMSETVNVTVSNNASQGHIKFNTLKLYCNDGSWSGKYPKECRLTLEAKPEEGFRFEKWEVSGAEFVSGDAASAEAVIKPTSSNVSVRAVYAEGEPQVQPPAKTYPENISTEYSEKYHQVRFTWDKVEGADRYGIAVYLAGKWRIQTQSLTSPTYTTPKNMTPGKTYKVAVAARVGGSWDIANAVRNAVTVTVK